MFKTTRSRCFQEVHVPESSANCNIENKGLLRMPELHLEFCDGKSWVRLLDQKVALNSREKAGQCRKHHVKQKLESVIRFNDIHSGFSLLDLYGGISSYTPPLVHSCN